MNLLQNANMHMGLFFSINLDGDEIMFIVWFWNFYDKMNTPKTIFDP
jgi:hypothetical protein